jgi:hypothetical protein
MLKAQRFFDGEAATALRQAATTLKVTASDLPCCNTLIAANNCQASLNGTVSTTPDR